MMIQNEVDTIYYTIFLVNTEFSPITPGKSVLANFDSLCKI